MKYIDEYRERELVNVLSKKIRRLSKGHWNIMEICGGQTHTIMKYNLQEFLPDGINLVHGPGCPVCVTPLEKIDKALAISGTPGTILASYGDMIRVPGSDSDLFTAKAGGADVRIIYSALDAIKIAEDNPNRKVVFFAIGFETTAPVNGQAVIEARKKNLKNFFILSSHVLVPPAMNLILSLPDSDINGFLAAGHVCTVMGYRQYLPVAEKYRIPINVTGFEPVDILAGIYANLQQLENGTYKVENNYRRSVTEEGNLKAQGVMSEVFEVVDQKWRGIGNIPGSGLRLKDEYCHFDAEKEFELGDIETRESEKCIAGTILQGFKKPVDCPAFGTECTPDNPLGAPMVSHEGACSAYYRYKN